MRKIFFADKYETNICNLYINKIRNKYLLIKSIKKHKTYISKWYIKDTRQIFFANKYFKAQDTYLSSMCKKTWDNY